MNAVAHDTSSKTDEPLSLLRRASRLTSKGEVAEACRLASAASRQIGELPRSPNNDVARLLDSWARQDSADTPQQEAPPLATLEMTIRFLLPRAWERASRRVRWAGRLRVATVLTAAAVVLTILATGKLLHESLSPEGVTVTYYRGTNFGIRVCRRPATKLSVDYDGQRPALGVPAEGFSAKWSGWLIAPTNDSYTFVAQSSGGMRMRLDGATIVDEWRDRKWEDGHKRIDMLLSAGAHRIELDHFCGKGNASLSVRWAGGGIARLETIGGANLRKRMDKGDK